MPEFRSPMERGVWKLAQRLTRVHWSDLLQFDVAASTAKKFVQRWEQQGVLARIDTDDGRKVFRWTDAPLEEPATPVYDSSPEGNMWRAMRMLKSFTATDIAAHANTDDVTVSEQKATVYCKTLVKSGHLKVRASRIRGQRAATYMMVNYTGPVAPKSRTVKGIHDANTDEFVSIDREVSL